MATETTLTSAGGWSPDVRAIAPQVAIPEALILQTSTVAGSIEGDAPAVRVTYVDDADADFVAEGGDIPEADPDLAEVLVFTGKVAQLIRLSREQWVQDSASGLLSKSVARAVTKRANRAYLAQVAPTTPAVTPPAGLLNVSGIVNGGAVATNLDALVDLVATLEDNDGTPSHWILSSTAWAKLRKLKTGTGLASALLGAGTSDTVKMLLDLPVLTTPAMTANTGMLVDKNAIVSAVGSVMVAQSEHAFFTSDSIALRCTWRFGQNVVKPNRIGKFTVT
jgi:HK97 family phage major capsid protein